MKILLCISTLKSGGAEKNISFLANLLIKKNYDVTILTFDKKNAKSFFYLNKNIKIINLNLLKKSHNTLERIQNFFTRIRSIRKVLIDGKYHCFISFINTMNITMLASSFFLNIKKIISDRNNPFFSRKSFFIRFLKYFFYKYSDKLVIQTKESKNFYKFINSKKILIISNFIDENFETKKNYKLGKKINIIVVSKLEKQKGIDILIESLSKINTKYKFKCDIYGKGTLFHNIEKIINKNNLAKSIKIKKIKALNRVYRNYDLYILSSYYEGYPNSLVEAMISGLPVISSSCNYGPKEIIINKFNGILFKVGSQTDLTKKIEFVANNYNLASKFGRRAKHSYDPIKINNRNLEKWLKIIR